MMEVRGTKEALVRRLLQKPLYRAAAMVRAGAADAVVAGADSPTRRVIEAASMGIGLANGVSIPSSYFLMIFPDGREFIFADCAVNVSPDVVTLGGHRACIRGDRQGAIGRRASRCCPSQPGQAAQEPALMSFEPWRSQPASPGRCRRMPP